MHLLFLRVFHTQLLERGVAGQFVTDSRGGIQQIVALEILLLWWIPSTCAVGKNVYANEVFARHGSFIKHISLTYNVITLYVS